MKTKIHFPNFFVRILFCAGVLISCQQDESIIPKTVSEADLEIGKTTTDLTPVITRFSPISGFPSSYSEDMSVVIEGRNFGDESPQLIVKFNNVQAEILQSSEEHILVLVPDGAKTGKISVELNDLKATSKIDFTVTPETAPVVTGYSTEMAMPGTQVNIYGLNFDADPLGNVVMFNGTPAVVHDADEYSLTVTVPAGATTGPVTVTAHDFTASGPWDFVVQSADLPVVGSFLPISGRPGTPVTLYGSGFSTVPSENEVAFNGVPAVVRTATTKILTVTVPPAATTGRITVTTRGVTATSQIDFVINTPVVETFSPVSGTAGALVTITGANFSLYPSENVVRFNGTAALVRTCTFNSLTVNVPAGATTGRITVSVSGVTGTSASDFTVIRNPAPAIVSFFPGIITQRDVSNGIIITVQGSNFSPVASTNRVRFMGSPFEAFVLQATENTLLVQVPPGTVSGFFNITVNGETALSPAPLIVQPFSIGKKK